MQSCVFFFLRLFPLSVLPSVFPSYLFLLPHSVSTYIRFSFSPFFIFFLYQSMSLSLSVSLSLFPSTSHVFCMHSFFIYSILHPLLPLSVRVSIRPSFPSFPSTSHVFWLLCFLFLSIVIPFFPLPFQILSSCIISYFYLCFYFSFPPVLPVYLTRSLLASLRALSSFSFLFYFPSLLLSVPTSLICYHHLAPVAVLLPGLSLCVCSGVEGVISPYSSLLIPLSLPRLLFVPASMLCCHHLAALVSALACVPLCVLRR